MVQVKFDKHTPHAGEQCRICLSPYEDGESFHGHKWTIVKGNVTTEGFHAFHSECIAKWLQQNSKCPTCWEDATLLNPPPVFHPRPENANRVSPRMYYPNLPSVGDTDQRTGTPSTSSQRYPHIGSSLPHFNSNNERHSLNTERNHIRRLVGDLQSIRRNLRRNHIRRNRIPNLQNMERNNIGRHHIRHVQNMEQNRHLSQQNQSQIPRVSKALKGIVSYAHQKLSKLPNLMQSVKSVYKRFHQKLTQFYTFLREHNIQLSFFKRRFQFHYPQTAPYSADDDLNLPEFSYSSRENKEIDELFSNISRFHHPPIIRARSENDKALELSSSPILQSEEVFDDVKPLSSSRVEHATFCQKLMKVFVVAFSALLIIGCYLILI